MTRYLKITLVDGTRFILRVTSESPLIVRGYEVNSEGDEVVPPGFERRLRVVGRDSIKKSVEMRMNNTYATLEVVPCAARSTVKIVNIVTDTATLAEAMYPSGGLLAFNTGAYAGTKIPVRKMTGREIVTVAGTVGGAKVISEETWIVDRFGELGARQIKRLRDLVRSQEIAEPLSGPTRPTSVFIIIRVKPLINKGRPSLQHGF